MRWKKLVCAYCSSNPCMKGCIAAGGGKESKKKKKVDPKLKTIQCSHQWPRGPKEHVWHNMHTCQQRLKIGESSHSGQHTCTCGATG